MPMPRWWGHINKRVFNPRELAKGTRPVIRHTGRASGLEYRTPLDAHRIDGGYLFILVYGSGCDWAQNILASGSATLEVGSTEVPLTNPRVVTGDEAWRLLPPDTKRPPKWLGIDEFLVMEA